VAILDAAFATRDRDAWVEHLRGAPGDFIFTIVNDPNDVVDDPQARVNGYVVDFDHPQHGTIGQIGLPVRLSETPGSLRAPAPELGQHSEEILLDLLGYDWDRISALREKGVL
jgi:crotonobetainyl-CoA:carnitine CoA-transferase CaiB-like acyl-CoA transferase